ncbi:MAG: PSD1 domain-containing protein [Acidobacteria bacterium]|nr:PSD1 domain-containing protein [Acidobacteriota bacterium]
MNPKPSASQKRFCKILLVLLLPLVALASISLSAPEPVRYGRDVLPILAANCFACHGPDERNRKAGLRLDTEADAKAKRRSGFAIAPGQPEKSLILARLTSADPDAVMPPQSSHKQVTPAQIETIRRWIAEGAAWGLHWSFEPVTRPVIAATKQSPIDALVSAKLVGKGLALRPMAAPQTLVRRLWLDVIGLPPTPELADQFAKNPSPAAYEKMVDELLAKPQFGEHWARMWLDLARYADTKGYEKDLGRTIWPYRDWVVNALNADMLLDQFTTEQLAGDLFPNPTQQQIIATAFHRNTMTNDEGGTDNEEFRVAAVKDRIDTTMQVWMGLTMGCAKCHSHKYDPISHNDYYSFFALFNQTEDADLYTDAPTLEMISPADEAERKRLQANIDRLNQALAAMDEAANKAKETGEKIWRAAPVKAAASRDGATLTPQPNNVINVSGKNPPDDAYTVTLTLGTGSHTALRLEVLSEKTANGEWAVGRDGGTANAVLSEISAELLRGTAAQRLRLIAPRADFAEANGAITNALDDNERTGWSVLSRSHEPHEAIFTFAEPLQLASETSLRVTLLQQAGDNKTMRRFRLSTTAANPGTLQPLQASPELRKLRDDVTAAYKAQKSFNDNLVRLPIMRELAKDKQRTTKIHLRGNFLEQGEIVQPNVPAAFGKLAEGAPRNRLSVAKWLVNRDNPLTPRVWANRIWARLFGIGIVETEEDFGAQGSAPTNPELLDWLAAEYRDKGWSLKNLLKTIVLSETYKQASETPVALREADPRNLLQSRGSRFRLSAEAVRDQALAVSGLLSSKMGGPPVMPPQPAGLWRSTYSGRTWIDAEGEDRFRRGLYTYLKRTTPYPAMTTFDGGSGEVCQIRRIRTNTPLQALVTLNDPVYLESAAGLARRMVTEAKTPNARAARGLRLALIRSLRAGETAPLLALQKDAEKSFAAAPEKAEALLKSARATIPTSVHKAAFAAWVVTANAILNLDEFLSRN